MALDASKLNVKNAAVKRLLQEYKELIAEQSREFVCEPLEDNIFEWHFVLRGPRDTEFEGGLYHGRIVLPPEYPFKPPTFFFFTPNGRFEVNTKICLSISTHHPEHWQPSWSLRTALVALAAFFPTKGDGAIGALDYPPQERCTLARASRGAPPVAGQSDARAAVTRSLHERMLALEALPPLSPPPKPAQAEAEAEVSTQQPGGSADDAASGSGTAVDGAVAAASAAAAADAAVPAADTAPQPQAPLSPPLSPPPASPPPAAAAAAAPMSPPPALATPASPPPLPAPVPAHSPSPSPVLIPRTPPPPASPAPPPQPHVRRRSEEELRQEEARLVRLAVALSVAIVALLLRRVMRWAAPAVGA